MRPFVWQNAPTQALPEELHDDDRGIPRRVDGTLSLATTSAHRITMAGTAVHHSGITRRRLPPTPGCC